METRLHGFAAESIADEFPIPEPIKPKWTLSRIENLKNTYKLTNSIYLTFVSLHTGGRLFAPKKQNSVHFCLHRYWHMQSRMQFSSTVVSARFSKRTSFPDCRRTFQWTFNCRLIHYTLSSTGLVRCSLQIPKLELRGRARFKIEFRYILDIRDRAANLHT